MDKQLTAHILRHLLENHFPSKAEMARQFEINERQMQRIMKNLDTTKAGTIALDKALCYCAQQHISLDHMLEDFIAESQGEASEKGLTVGQSAFTHLHMSCPKHLKPEGMEVYDSMLSFLRQVSARVCPACKTWCNPWDGKHDAENLDCYIGHIAREIVKDITEVYSEAGEHE